MVIKKLVNETTMLIGDHLEQFLFQLDWVHLPHALVLTGDHDVDAIRLVGMRIYPVEFGL